MTNAARSSAMLSIVSRSNVVPTTRRGQLSIVTTDGAAFAGDRTDTNAPSPDAPTTRRSLFATVGRFLSPKAPTKGGDRVNADFWDQRHMS